jgi:vacuolar-type H+-ATPase subunit B/Vma2
MGTLADGLAPRPLHEQRGRFHVHGQNFYNALEEAERLDMAVDIRALTQSMASFSLHSRNFADASRLFERRLEGQGRLETRNVRRPLTIRWEWLRLNSGTLQRRKVVSQIA